MTTFVPIKVYTNDRMVANDIVEPEDGRMAAGDTRAEIDDRAELVYEGAKIQKSFGISDIVQLSLMMSGSVASGLVANWLYDRLKDREAVLEIGGEEVEVDEEAIQTKLDEFQE